MSTPSILTEKVTMVPVDRLLHHPANPRIGSVQDIAASMRANGFYGTITAQLSTGFVLVGNHRLKAAKAVGIQEVPVTYVDVDDATAKRILVADNRTSDLADYDAEALAAVLQDLVTTEDTEGIGYTQDDLAELLGHQDVQVLDAMPSLPEGDREPLQQMSFIVHDAQADVVRDALRKAKKLGALEEGLNHNSNGNGLHRICAAYLEIGDG